MALVFYDNTSTTEIPEKSQWVSVSIGKVITAIVMFASVIVVIYTPIIVFGRLDLSRQRNSFRGKLQLWIGRLSCFAAGVFLSTGFMDIFPDVIQSIYDAGIKLNIKTSFPIASFFTLIGFFLILSIEQMSLIYQNHLKKFKQNKNKEKVKVKVDEENFREPFLPSVSEQSLNENFADGSNAILITEEQFRPYQALNKDEGHGETGDHGNIFHHSKSRIFALMSAMSVHAVFEGLAIGLGTTIAGITQLFVALLLHKLIIAGSLGLNLATSQLKIWVKLVVSLIFALGSPVGILLGLLIMYKENGHNIYYMVGGILEGIACGTFLYVVFFEILPHELGPEAHDDRGVKLISLIFGFVFVSLYLLIIPFI